MNNMNIDSPLVTLNSLTNSINKIDNHANIQYTPNTMLTLAEMKCASLKELLKQKNEDLDELRLFTEYEQTSNSNGRVNEQNTMKSNITNDILNEDVTESKQETIVDENKQMQLNTATNTNTNQIPNTNISLTLEIQQLKANNALLTKSLPSCVPNPNPSPDSNSHVNQHRNGMSAATRQILKMI